ncbi:toxin-antitoxin system YwqK family antitoxin [Aquimarina sp. 2-A2]|uniref:toxin-antitoxin system YwqK family antitoxin n=1 Tax=Aquimarina sp. 2-A2 TaxID=3382644 RepID=UPI00387EF065
MKYYFIISFLWMTSATSIAQSYNLYDADGKRHGKWQKTYENSKQLRYEGNFEHGKEIGEFKFYKPGSGNKPTAIKVFSKKTDTVHISYFSQKGRLMSKGTLLNKKRVGRWEYYHNNSDKLMMTEFYKNDKVDGEQLTYFPNGQLTERVTYVNGKREGRRFIYSEQGALIKEFTYENDQLHGLTKYYDPEGILLIEGSYKHDRKDGIWNYYKDGKLTEQKTFPLRAK